ncbi:hypothetical protein, partial [Klebsiella africana]|uniref:hypothetical protein n=1 Tax=Klebsiella africana TaxID=2489010 RepID=UPI0028A69957
MMVPHFTVSNETFRNSLYDAYHIPLLKGKDIILLWNFSSTPFYTSQGLALREGANKQVISSQADSLIK